MVKRSPPCVPIKSCRLFPYASSRQRRRRRRRRVTSLRRFPRCRLCLSTLRAPRAFADALAEEVRETTDCIIICLLHRAKRPSKRGETDDDGACLRIVQIGRLLTRRTNVSVPRTTRMAPSPLPIQTGFIREKTTKKRYSPVARKHES